MFPLCSQYVPTLVPSINSFRFCVVPSVPSSIVYFTYKGTRAIWLYNQGNIRKLLGTLGTENIFGEPVHPCQSKAGADPDHFRAAAEHVEQQKPIMLPAQGRSSIPPNRESVCRHLAA
jgi:hypothetical protein